MSRVSCSKEMFRSSQPSVCIQVGLPDPDRYSTMGANPKGRREGLVLSNSSRLQFRPVVSGSEWICRESHNKHRPKWYNFWGEPPSPEGNEHDPRQDHKSGRIGKSQATHPVAQSARCSTQKARESLERAASPSENGHSNVPWLYQQEDSGQNSQDQPQLNRVFQHPGWQPLVPFSARAALCNDDRIVYHLL